MSGVLDVAGPMGARDSAPTSVAFPPNKQRRHPDFQIFRGSIPRLHVPLSTLRVQPLDWPRMTRGRCGSLSLHRTALSSAPPRRFIPAHLFIPQRHHGIDLGRPAGGEIASEQSRPGQEQRSNDKGQRVGGANSVSILARNRVRAKAPASPAARPSPL